MVNSPKGDLCMKKFIVYIQVNNEWLFLDTYEADTWYEAVAKAREDKENLLQYYPEKYLDSVNLDAEEVGKGD